MGEAVAVAVHLEDVDVAGEPVEQGAGQALGAEHGCPLLIATRNDKLGATFFAFIQVAAIRIFLRSIESTA